VRSDYSTIGGNSKGFDHLWVGTTHWHEAYGGHYVDAWIRNVKVFDTSLDTNEVILEKTNFFNSLTTASLAPSSAPTTLTPTLTPSLVPTLSPSITKAGTNEWYINNNGNITEETNSKNTVLVYIPFNTSNVDHDANVYLSDCITDFNDTDNLFDVDTTESTSSKPDGFVQFNTTLLVNITALNNTNYWTPFNNGDRGGWVEVCVETYLELEDTYELGNDESKQKITFKNNVLNISVSLSTDFTVDSVDIEREDATEENVNTDYSDEITAYECDKTDLYTVAAGKSYNQGEEITICVTDKGNGLVQVEEFNNLVVAQSGISDYNYILNGLWNADITTPVCVDGLNVDQRVCYAKIRALARFFPSVTPPALTITGSVYVIRNGRRVRRKLHSALPVAEKQNKAVTVDAFGRRVQEDDGNGNFKLTVGLAHADDSVVSGSSIESTAAALMTMAVGTAALMV